jgi:hypothetical protein
VEAAGRRLHWIFEFAKAGGLHGQTQSNLLLFFILAILVYSRSSGSAVDAAGLPNAKILMAILKASRL